jgi:hypothetical protein
MSCNKVILSGTSSTAGKTTVTWLKPAVTGLAGYLITMTGSGGLANFEVNNPDATSATETYTAVTDTLVTVTPKDGSGPVNTMASAPTPVPFPILPVDPASKRPVSICVCVDSTAGTVTVDWIASTIPDLAGYLLSIIEGTTRLTNFDVPDADAITKTVTYTIDMTQQYQVIVTPYDDLSPDRENAAYPVPAPYPGAGAIETRAYLSNPDHLGLKSEIRRP